MPKLSSPLLSRAPIAQTLFAMLLLVGLLLAVLAGDAQTVQAADATTAEAPLAGSNEAIVQSGAQALQSADFNWYDAEQDSLKRVDIPAPRQQAPSTPSAGRGRSFANWGGDFGQILTWIALAVGLAVLALALIMAFLRRENRAVEVVRSPQVTRSRAARIEALPFAVEEPATDLLSTARRHAEMGDFNQAVIYQFSHQLMALDQHHWIYLTEGTTNRQYLRQLPRNHQLRDIFETTMVAFEEAFFGHHPLTRARFEECWALLPEFDQLVTRRDA